MGYPRANPGAGDVYRRHERLTGSGIFGRVHAGVTQARALSAPAKGSGFQARRLTPLERSRITVQLGVVSERSMSPSSLSFTSSPPASRSSRRGQRRGEADAAHAAASSSRAELFLMPAMKLNVRYSAAQTLLTSRGRAPGAITLGAGLLEACAADDVVEVGLPRRKPPRAPSVCSKGQPPPTFQRRDLLVRGEL